MAKGLPHGEDLTDKQQLFADLYFELNNGTQAAIAAGYSEKGAHVQASVLLKHPKVRKYLDDLHNERKQRIMNNLSSYAENAVKELFKMAMNEEVPDATRLNALKDILDRTGFKPVEKKEINGEHNGKFSFSFVDPNEKG